MKDKQRVKELEDEGKRKRELTVQIMPVVLFMR